MDIGSFLQENKRWLLGCALGGVVFVVARVVIGSIYDPRPLQQQAGSNVSAAQKPDSAVYDQKAQQDLRAEGEALAAERDRLVPELSFQRDPAWQIENKGMSPDEYLGKVGRELKLRIQRAASERHVDAPDKDLAWTSPAGVDEIRNVLFGLELVDVASRRLFAAHDAVCLRDPEAPGLASIRFTVDEGRNKSSGRHLKPGEVDVRDLVDQQRIAIEFRSDAATAFAFLESCREPGRTLGIEPPLLITQPTRRGEPLTVKGNLIGIAFKAEPKGN